MSQKKTRRLSDAQIANAELSAFRAFRKKYETYNPPPKTDLNVLRTDTRGAGWIYWIVRNVSAMIVIALLLLFIQGFDHNVFIFGETTLFLPKIIGGIVGFLSVIFLLFFTSYLGYQELQTLHENGDMYRVTLFSITVSFLSWVGILNRPSKAPIAEFSTSIMLLEILAGLVATMIRVIDVNRGFSFENIAYTIMSIFVSFLIPVSIHMLGGLIASDGAVILRTRIQQMLQNDIDVYNQAMEGEWRQIWENGFSAEVLHRHYLKINGWQELPAGEQSPYLEGNLVVLNQDGVPASVPLVQQSSGSGQE